MDRLAARPRGLAAHARVLCRGIRHPYPCRMGSGVRWPGRVRRPRSDLARGSVPPPPGGALDARRRRRERPAGTRTPVLPAPRAGPPGPRPPSAAAPPPRSSRPGSTDRDQSNRRSSPHPRRQAQRRAVGRAPGCAVRPVLTALAERTGIDPAPVDDVVWGCVAQVGEQTMDIGRNAVLSAGWPLSVPGTTVDRQCGSSQQSVHFAAAGLIAGQYDVVVAGGVESMCRVPMGRRSRRFNPFGPALDWRASAASRRTRASARRPSPSAGACPAPSSTSSRWPHMRRRRRLQDAGRLRRPDRRRSRSADGTVVDRRRGHAAWRHAGGARQAQARLQARTALSTRATARRSATAPPRC